MSDISPAPAGQHAAAAPVSPEPEAIAHRLASEPPGIVAELLEAMGPAEARERLRELDPSRRLLVLGSSAPETSRQWLDPERYPGDSVGQIMDPPLAVFPPDLIVGEAIEQLRELVRKAFVTYLFVIDSEGRLIGVVAMRELLLAEREQRLGEIMLRDPFFLSPGMPLLEAMRQVLDRHFPVYPVCDEQGRLVGLVRGQTLFERQAVEISALPGRMVGVEMEERLATRWSRSLRLRHPWLQLNLLTGFVAAGVVGVFEATIDQIVLLAVFLPVLMGQASNTGAQTLAVTLRGITLGELGRGRERGLVGKETLLGLVNGALTGITAGLGMFLYAAHQGHPRALSLGLVVLLAMIGSCIISGIVGALVPLALRRLGSDPATASSIFLTTVTDVVSMGMFLGLATWILL